MRAFVALYWASALLTQGTLGSGDTCETRTQWGDNACELGGGLQVKSVPNNLEVTSQKCDSFYKKSEFQKQPVVQLVDAKSGELYVVVMVDPDAPKHPKGTYYLHWIVANVPGLDLEKGDLKNGTMLTSYVGPSPPDGTGIHRYMFLVFRQPSGTRLAQETPALPRARFSLGEWLLNHKLCGPSAGVQFRTNFSGNPKS